MSDKPARPQEQVKPDNVPAREHGKLLGVLDHAVANVEEQKQAAALIREQEARLEQGSPELFELTEQQHAKIAEQATEIERLKEYDETLEALRWYIGARQVNSEEAAMASKKAIREFEAAEKRIKEKRR